LAYFNDMPEVYKSRINSIDLIRGFAVLGILLMNITSFSQVGIAYLNPLVGAGYEGSNLLLWDFNWLFSDMRFMNIFSMLFGAGVIIFSTNLEVKGKKAWPVHFRRMFLLLGFGLAHAYFIWAGDILVAYSICGIFVFLLRNKSIKTLGILASIMFVIPVILSVITWFGVPPAELVDIFAFYTPSQAEIDAEVQAMLGSYREQTAERINQAIELQTFIFWTEIFWRASALMLLGMILYKTGVLSGDRSEEFYKKLALIGIPIGLIISGVGLYLVKASDWNGAYVMTIGAKFNYVGSLPLSLGYIALMILVNKRGYFSGLQSRLMSAGRMAFTNYIFMSVCGMMVFYGVGLGLIMTFERWQMMLLTMAIWVVILLMSPIILTRFKQGPLEKFWRYLTYYQI
jgi:uncharacterized protein